VAIKRIELKNQSGSLEQEFLKSELATLEKVKARNAKHLLLLEEIIRTVNNLYIITEFCEGKDLAKILREKQSFSEQQAHSAMKQIIQGYHELYSMGFIHRDLKLSNLFLTHGKIKLADFGFTIGEDQCNFGFDYNVGSQKYMSPETLKSNKYSFKSDAWAIGVMAYELVYGEVPWKNKDDAKLYELITTVPVSNLFNSNISVSSHYKSFIVSCLQPNIAQRANPDFIFNYPWPMAQDTVQGVEEKQKSKTTEIIKVPGKNYAVFHANRVSYESEQPDPTDFVNSSQRPTQFILVSQLSYCRFLIDLHKCIKAALAKSSSPILSALNDEIALTVQIIMKALGEVACMQKNRFETADFEGYMKTGEWQNLKQVIIKHDIEFRTELQHTHPLSKGAAVPKTNTLVQAIAYLKGKLPGPARLLDKLVSYFEVSQIFVAVKPLQFAESSNIIAIAKEALVADSQKNNS
jgi:serine/threonine protein kinase